MKTISSAVEEYIKSKPFLVSALTQGIINLTSPCSHHERRYQQCDEQRGEKWSHCHGPEASFLRF